MKKRLKGVSLIGGLLLLASILVISGCSNNSPLEPNLPQTAEMDRLVVSGMSAGESSEEPTVIEDSELIDKDAGGVIEIQREGYLHLFTVEPAALSASTEITVKSSREKIFGKDMIVFDFGPDGLVFNISAVLDFEIAELNSKASSAKLYYYDPGLKRWVYQGSSAISGGVASFDIDHFSKYAIGD